MGASKRQKRSPPPKQDYSRKIGSLIGSGENCRRNLDFVLPAERGAGAGRALRPRAQDRVEEARSCLAPKARHSRAAWATPQGFVQSQTASAESAIHSGANLCGTHGELCVELRFQRWFTIRSEYPGAMPQANM